MSSIEPVDHVADVKQPEKYKESTSIRSVQSVSAVLSNSYFAILITLHRNFLPPNPDFPRPKPPPSSQSLSHCVEAARSVIHIAANQRTLVPPSHHLAVACQHLWSSAVILLLCEVQAREQVVVDAVGSHVESCRKSLQALEPVWPGSRKLKELLNDVELRAKQVVVAAKAPPCRSPNKRKPALHETAPHGKRPMGLPVADPLTNHAGRLNSVDWHYQQASTGSGSHKHPSSKPRYQTSDTRTNIREKDRAAQPWQMAPSNSDLTTSVEQPIDTSFDIGGVDFNGLDMLQGFTGADLASFWNTFHVEAPLSSQIPPTSLSMSRQNTPSSVPGNASGSSPGTWAFQSPSAAVDGSGTDAEFWSQVTGSTFDWGADPSVPFNI